LIPALLAAHLWGFAWTLINADWLISGCLCVCSLTFGYFLIRKLQPRPTAIAWILVSAALTATLLGSLLTQRSAASPPGLANSSFEIVSTEVILEHQVSQGFWIAETRSINGKALKIPVSISDPERISRKSGCTLAGQARLVPSGRPDRPWLLKLQARHFKQTCQSLDPFASVRNNFLSQIRGVSQDARALVAGLAIGDTTLLSAHIKDQMKTLSLTHLTAVSGANCAIVLALVYLLLSRLPVRRWMRAVLTALSLAMYLQLVGPQPSVLRAAFMSLVILLLSISGRSITPIAALSLAAVALIEVNPFLATDFGFALSVAATAGILMVTPWLFKKFRKVMPVWMAGVFSVSAAAQIWCAPILLQLQPGLPTYSLLANALVEPLVAPITILGLLSCLCSLAFSPLAGATSWLASLPAQLIVAITTKFSALPFGTLWWPSGTLGTVLLIALAISITLRALRKGYSLASWLAFGTALTIVFVGSLGFFKSTQWPIRGWQVVNCDVGQGDALVLRSQNQVAVIDVGRDPDPIDKCLNRLGVNTIDLLVLTHFDADHVGGLSGALKDRKVVQGLVSDFHDDRPQAMATEDALKRACSTFTRAFAGMKGSLGLVDWLVLQPEKDGLGSDDPNDGSVSIRWNSPDFTLFTLADLGEKGQMRLVDLHADWINVDRALPVVLKVSHHGSADQYPELIEWLEPAVALISVGAGNSYGHPTARILKILQHLGSNIFRTDQMGAISVGTNAVDHRLSVATGG